VQRIPAAVRKKARKIRLLLLDVDGVLTDGGIVLDHHGDEIKRFHVQDGHGIRLLQSAGIQVGLLTARSSPAVAHRAAELEVRLVFQNANDKKKIYEQIKRRTRLKDQQIAYMGDDLPDLPILLRVGFAVAVRDGWDELKHRVDYVTVKKGGRGAVREVAEVLLKAHGAWAQLLKRYSQ
jgi:3-deoxy-D-manno-octulosonate 8-phosphate phosphatase (KDO 8-P phosphatase)